MTVGAEVKLEFFFFCRRPWVGGSADYDSDSEASQRIGQRWRVAVNEHKTQNTHGSLEVNLSQRDLLATKAFAWKSRATKNLASKVFEESTWQRMRTLLKRLIEPEAPKLWEAANRDKPLGSHEFRRLQMARIDEGPGETREARVRAIGANPLMIDKHYKDARKQSHQRTLDVFEDLDAMGAAGELQSAT